MALTTFQAALYFVPKPETRELLRRFADAVSTVGKQLRIRVRPEAEVDRAILGGNLEQFAENGEQLFLEYDEPQKNYPDEDWSLHVQFIADYPQSTAVLISPALSEPTKELTNFVWNRLLTIVKGLVLEMKPLIAQINGVDDEGGSQIVSAKTVGPTKLPQFFTPYTYLDRSIATVAIVERLTKAGAYSIEKTGNGWSIQIVDDFFSSPSRELLRSMREILGTTRSAYKQTKMDD